MHPVIVHLLEEHIRELLIQGDQALRSSQARRGRGPPAPAGCPPNGALGDGPPRRNKPRLK